MCGNQHDCVEHCAIFVNADPSYERVPECGMRLSLPRERERLHLWVTIWHKLREGMHVPGLPHVY